MSVFDVRNEATKIESFAQAMLTERPGESQAELGLMKELEKLQKGSRCSSSSAIATIEGFLQAYIPAEG